MTFLSIDGVPIAPETVIPIVIHLAPDWTEVPARVRIAAEYCAARGATVQGGREWVAVSERLPRGKTMTSVTFGRLVGITAEIDGSTTVHGERCELRVTVSNATDADAVALRLAGFVPVENGWRWSPDPQDFDPGYPLGGGFQVMVGDTSGKTNITLSRPMEYAAIGRRNRRGSVARTHRDAWRKRP